MLLLPKSVLNIFSICSSPLGFMTPIVTTVWSSSPAFNHLPKRSCPKLSKKMNNTKMPWRAHNLVCNQKRNAASLAFLIYLEIYSSATQSTVYRPTPAHKLHYKSSTRCRKRINIETFSTMQWGFFTSIILPKRLHLVFLCIFGQKLKILKNNTHTHTTKLVLNRHHLKSTGDSDIKLKIKKK